MAKFEFFLQLVCSRAETYLFGPLGQREEWGRGSGCESWGNWQIERWMGGQTLGPRPSTGKQKGVLLTVWGAGGGSPEGSGWFYPRKPLRIIFPPMSLSILFRICMYLVFESPSPALISKWIINAENSSKRSQSFPSQDLFCYVKSLREVPGPSGLFHPALLYYVDPTVPIVPDLALGPRECSE